MRRWQGKPIVVYILAVFTMTIALLGLGCSDDDDDFEAGVDIAEIENKTFNFADGRAFGLTGQQVTLEIGTFGSPGLDSDEAPFTLTSGGLVSQGALNLNRGTPVIEDNPFLGNDFAQCNFENQTSSFTVPGLRQTEVLETNCDMSDDRTQFRIENNGQVSTGDFVP
jgi:hypothetical protein